MGQSDDSMSNPMRKIRRSCRSDAIIKRIPCGPRARVASSDLSIGERKAVATTALLGRNASVFLLDAPAGALGKRKARKRIGSILRATGDATVMVAMSEATRLNRFDRIIQLRKGRVVFDGTPAAWRQQHLETKAEDVVAAPDAAEGVR